MAAVDSNSVHAIQSDEELAGSKVASISAERATGYQGIWFALGQRSEFGDKYSGGLGTYTAKHLPLAIYSPEVEKTFFVYGGTRPGQRHLLAMIGYYDHRRHLVPKPTVVHDKLGVDDPHDNPSLAMDDQGFLWVFVSGRGRRRPGFIYRSAAPYSIDSFELVREDEFTYPQPFYESQRGFIHLFTQYTRGRELYWSLSPDGRTWSQPQKLAGMGGHYQISNYSQGRIVSVFNMHPNGNVDQRTNMYYVQSIDWGKNWTTIEGTALQTPLDDRNSLALIRDFEKEGYLVYNKDIQLDHQGHPVILSVISQDHRPGPIDPPRTVLITRWNGSDWLFHTVTQTNHNYDTGCFYIENDGSYRLFFPSHPGPQPYGTGGEVVLWTSQDQGSTWTKQRSVTEGSSLNHGYVRRPVNAHEPFYAFWADGNPDTFSESRIYFTDRSGEKLWQLPYEMGEDYLPPIEVKKPAADHQFSCQPDAD